MVKAALAAAATEAHDWLSARFETSFPPYFDGAQWALPALPELIKTAPTFYESADLYPVDQRAVTHYWAFTTVKHLGEGQFYLMSIRDKQGRVFDGGKTYCLTVPPKVPVKQYWSAVVYDRATHALIRETLRSSRSSQSQGLQTNADGSVDIYFGPAAPDGKESNWIPTKSGGTFEVLIRLYGPEKPLFDKTWKLPDIELTK
jgi:hypothetical protein